MADAPSAQEALAEVPRERGPANALAAGALPLRRRCAGTPGRNQPCLAADTMNGRSAS
jgi:hypothetical protein